MSLPALSATALQHGERPARIVVQGAPNAARDRTELLAGLLERPARISPRFLYDLQGRALYGAICRLDEYHPARLEAEIVQAQAPAIAAALPRDAQWIELGCGDAAKSQAWLARVSARRFIGVDYAEDWLRETVPRIARDGAVEAIGVVADFSAPWSLHGLLSECRQCPPVFFYSGSSIGNFEPAEAVAVLRAIHAHCGERGRLLIGVDFIKSKQVLERAYDDELGLTAAFNRNLLRVVNRRLQADFALRRFAHLALFNRRWRRVEMHLMAVAPQTVRFGLPPRAQRRFDTGETIVTEHSYKYDPQEFAELLRQAGFSRLALWTDAAAGYGLFLGQP